MSEFYEGLARGYLGKRLIKAFSLPYPAPLLRPSEIRFRNQNTLQGHIILSGFTPNDLFKSCIQTLTQENPAHAIDPKIHWHGPTTPESRIAINTHGLQTMPTHLPPSSRGTFSALVLNTQHYRSAEGLEKLFDDCQSLLPLLGKRAHVLLLSPETTQTHTTHQQRYLEGFTALTKCLAKEMAPEATTINHLRVYDNRHQSLPALLRYFLSNRSSYVTGQCVSVGLIPSAQRWAKKTATSSAAPLAASNPEPHHLLNAPKKPLALVTGATGGIGRAIAHRLAADNFRIILVDQPREKFALRYLAEKTGGIALSLDLTRPNSSGALAECIDDHGGKLQSLVHNAGIIRDRLFKNMGAEAWQSVLNTNLWAPIKITENLLKEKKLADQARIVLMSSVMALSGNRGQTQYCLAKAGLMGFMQDIAPQIAKAGMTINTIAPGFIDTPMTQRLPKRIREIAKRYNAFAQAGRPEDVAEAVALCCQPTADFFSGNVLRVCGLMPHGR